MADPVIAHPAAGGLVEQVYLAVKHDRAWCAVPIHFRSIRPEKLTRPCPIDEIVAGSDTHRQTSAGQVVSKGVVEPILAVESNDSRVSTWPGNRNAL